MKKHPYTSSVFIKKWLDHFDKDSVSVKFEAIEGPVFLKKRFPPIYLNSGSNFTLQAFYSIIPTVLNTLREKIVVVYDVPDYFIIDTINQNGSVKTKTVKEYIGFLIDLKDYATVDDYVYDRFNAKNRSKFRGYKRKLEHSFPIQYKMFYGNIDIEHYNYIFDCFHKLSKKSFNKKKTTNKKLEPVNIAFIKDVTYDLILQKQACLFVVYDGQKPIGISLNFNSEDILFGDSTVYDLNYSSFNVGIIMLIKQIEWCLSNNIKTYDFSKGYFPYKEKWCNRTYHFEHHIIYDSNHLASSLTMLFYAYFLRLKQYLREHPIRDFLKNQLKKRVH